MPALLIDKLLNVATPLTAATVTVPLNVPPPGLSPIVRVTMLSSVVTIWPKPFSTSTVIEGEMFAPATVLLGPWANTNMLEPTSSGMRAAALGLPRPVAKSKPVPGRYEGEPLVGPMLFPVVMSLK